MKASKAKTIVITSSKGGVGKTILTLNLAGIYQKLGKKVLILDLDLGTGAISLNLNLSPEKTFYNAVDDIGNNRYKNYQDYVTNYTDFIDVIASPKDPRQASKADSRYLDTILSSVLYQYDIILIDTTHGLSRMNITALDFCDICLYVLTNDLMDLKNTKSFMSIMRDIEKENIKVVLNNSVNPSLNYFSNFDIKNIIKKNIDYTVSSNLNVKNITKYILEGHIFTLNKNLVFKDKKDLKKLEIMAIDLLKEQEES